MIFLFIKVVIFCVIAGTCISCWAGQSACCSRIDIVFLCHGWDQNLCHYAKFLCSTELETIRKPFSVSMLIPETLTQITK